MGKQPWTFEMRAQLRRLAESGHSVDQMAAILGRTRGSVAGTASRLNIKICGPKQNKPRGAALAAMQAKAARGGQPPQKTERRAALPPKPAPVATHRPIVTTLDEFAELIANGVSVDDAGVRLFGAPRAGRFTMMLLEARFGWQAA